MILPKEVIYLANETINLNPIKFGHGVAKSMASAIKQNLEYYMPFTSESIGNVAETAFDIAGFISENRPDKNSRNDSNIVKSFANRTARAAKTLLHDVTYGDLDFTETRNSMIKYINKYSHDEFAFDFDDGEYDSDEDNDFEGESSFTVEDFAEGMYESTTATIGAVEASTRTLAKTTVKSNAVLGDRLISNNMANMAQMMQMGNAINTNISGINANLASLVEYNNNTMNGFIENTVKHFNKVESFMDEVLKRYNRADEDEKRKKEIEANRRKEAVFDGLHINIGNAARKAIESLDAELGNSGIITGTAGLLLSILGGGNTPKWFQGAGDASTISQWIQIINPTKLLADAFLPNLKQAGQLDKLMKGAMASFKKKLTADKDNGGGGFFSSDSFLGRLFGSIFGNDDFRFGKRYENKEASWMASDSKALQLIPNKMDETQNLIQKLTKVTENIEEILAHSMTNALDLNKYVLNFNKDMLAFHRDMLDNNGNPPSNGGSGGGRRAASINRITQRNDVLDYHRRRNYNVTKEMTRRRIQNKHDYEDLEFDKLVFDEKQGRMVSSSEMLADYYAKKQSALGIRDFSAEIEDLISKHGSIELSEYDLKEANEKLAKLIDAINSGDIDYFDDDGNLDADAILQELNDNVLEGLDDLQISGLYAAKFIGWLYEKNEDMKKKSAAFQDEVMSNPVILSILKDINPKFNPYDITDMDDVKAILSEDFSGNNAQYAQIAKTLTTDQKRSMRSRAKYANAELGKSREASERLATYSNVINAFESGRMKLFDDADIQSDWKQYLQDHYNTTDVFTAFERGGREFENMLDAKAAKEIKKAIQTKEAMSEGSKYQKQSYRTQKLSRNPINWAFGALNDTLTDILSDVFTDFNDGEYKKAGKGILGIFSSKTLTNIANAYGDRKITYTPGYDEDGNPVAVKIYDLKEHPGEVLIVRADGYDGDWEPDPYFEKVVRYNAKHGGYEWDEDRQLFLDKDGKRSDLQYNPYVRPDLRVFEDSGNELEGHAQGAMRIDKDKVVQVHEGEMILDASLSDKVRDNFAEMIKAGGFTSLDHRAQKELIESISQSGDQFKGREMEVINTINNEINRHNIQNISSADLSKGSPVFIKTDTDDTLYTSFIKKTHEIAANLAILAGAKIEEFAEKREEKEQEKANGMGKTLKDRIIGSKGENGELTGGYFSEHINGIKSGFSDGVIKPMKDRMLANALVIAKNEGMSELETEEFLKNCENLIDGFPKGVAGGLVGLVMGGPIIGLLGGLFASNKVVRELVFGKIVKDDGGRHTVVGGMFGEFTSKLAKVGDDMVFNFKDAFREVGGNLKTGFSLFVKHITNGVNDAITENINDFFEQVNGSKEKKSFLAELFAGIKKAAYNVADTASDVAMDALSIGSKLVFNTAKIPFNMVAGLLGGKDYRTAKREQRRSRIKSIYDELVANDARMGISDITPSLVKAGKATKDFFLQPIRPAYGLGVDFMAMDKGWKEQSMLYKASNAISTGAGKVKAGAKSSIDKIVSGVERLNESFGGNFLKNIMQAIGGTIIPIGASILTGNPLPAIIGLPLVAGNTVFKQAIGTGIIAAALAAIKKLPRVAKTRTTGIRTFFRNRGHAVKQALGINDDKYYLKNMHDSTAMQGAKLLGDLGIDPEEYMRLKNASDLSPEEWNKLAEYDDAIKSGWNINDKARYNELKKQQEDFEAASIRKRYGGLSKEQYDRLQDLNSRIDSGKLTEAERAERDQYLKTMENYDAGADIELINNWQANAAANKREMFEKGWNSRDNFKANNPGFYKNRIKAIDSMMDNPFSIAASKFNNELRDLTVEDVQKMYPELSKEQAESIVHQYKNERFDLRKQIKHKFGNLDQFTFEEHSDEIREMLANSDTIGKSKAALANASDAELRSFILGGQTTTVEEDFRNDLLTNVTTITKLLDGTAPQFMDNLRQLVGLSPKHEEKDNSNSNKYDFTSGSDEEEIEELMKASGISREQAERIVAGHHSGMRSSAVNPDLISDQSSNPTNVAFADVKPQRIKEVTAAIDETMALKNEGVDFDKINDPEYQLSLKPELLKRAKAALNRKKAALKAYYKAPDNISMSVPTGAPVDISEFMPELNVTPHAEGVLNIAKNEIAQLHAGEAVLDAETAKSFRSGAFGGESIASIFSDMKSGIGELVGVFKGDKTASGDAKKSFLDQMKESFTSVGTKMSNAVFSSGLIPLDPKTGKLDLAKIGARLVALIGGAVLFGPTIMKLVEKLKPILEPIWESFKTSIDTVIRTISGAKDGESTIHAIGRGIYEAWEAGGKTISDNTVNKADTEAWEDQTEIKHNKNAAVYQQKLKAAGSTIDYSTYIHFTSQCVSYFTAVANVGQAVAKALSLDTGGIGELGYVSTNRSTNRYNVATKISEFTYLSASERAFIDEGISNFTNKDKFGEASITFLAGDVFTFSNGALMQSFEKVIQSTTGVRVKYIDHAYEADANATNEELSKGIEAMSDRIDKITNSKVLSRKSRKQFEANEQKTYASNPVYVSDSTSTGNGIGYGYTQNDPRWATMGYGRFKSGGMSTMGSGGCGPTAMSNVYTQLTGSPINPAQMARFAQANGYNAQGGTSAGLFTSGARKLGLTSKAISKSGSAIGSSVMRGNNVIVAGKNGPYTRAGHIMSVRGVDRFGNAIVDDPLRRGARRIPMGKLTKGMTHAWSIGNGIGYGDLIPYTEQKAGDTPYSTWTPFNNGTATFNTNGGAFGFDSGLGVGCLYKSLLSAWINSAMGEDETFDMYANNFVPLPLLTSGKLGNSVVTSGENAGAINDATGMINALNALVGGSVKMTDIASSLSADTAQTLLDNLNNGNPIVIHTKSGTDPNNPDLKDLINTPQRSDKDSKHDQHAALLAGIYNNGSGDFVLVDNPDTGHNQLEIIPVSSFTNAINKSYELGNKGYNGQNMLNHLYVFGKNSIKTGYDKTKLGTPAIAGANATNAGYTGISLDNTSSVSNNTPNLFTGGLKANNTTSNSIVPENLLVKTDHETFGDYLADLIGRLTQFGSNMLGTFLTGNTDGLFASGGSSSSPTSGGGGSYSSASYSSGMRSDNGYLGVVNNIKQIVHDTGQISLFLSEVRQFASEPVNAAITKGVGSNFIISEGKYKEFTNNTSKYAATVTAMSNSESYWTSVESLNKDVSYSHVLVYTWIVALAVSNNITYSHGDNKADAEKNNAYAEVMAKRYYGKAKTLKINLGTPHNDYYLIDDGVKNPAVKNEIPGGVGGGGTLSAADIAKVHQYMMDIITTNETGASKSDPDYIDKAYFTPYWLSGENNITLGRVGFYDSNAAKIFSTALNHSDTPEAVKNTLSYLSTNIKSRSLSPSDVTSTFNMHPEIKPYVMAAEDAMTNEFTWDYIKRSLEQYQMRGMQDPRSIILAAEFAGTAPDAVPSFYSSVTNPGAEDELDQVRQGMFNTIARWRNYNKYEKGWKNRINGMYDALTSANGYNPHTGKYYPVPSEVAALIPNVSIGNGDAGYSMRDNVHMYTDDVYMGDADHPMHVTMDHTSVTSRLDKLVELVDTALNGKPEPVAGTSNAKTLGMGKGETKPTQQISSSKGYSSLGQQDKLSQIHNRIARRTRVGTNYNQM